MIPVEQGKCRVYRFPPCDPENCTILQTVTNQATSGGYPTPEDYCKALTDTDSEKPGNTKSQDIGPYYGRIQWMGLIIGYESLMQRHGCPYHEKISNAMKVISDGKEAGGELLW